MSGNLRKRSAVSADASSSPTTSSSTTTSIRSDSSALSSRPRQRSYALDRAVANLHMSSASPSAQPKQRSVSSPSTMSSKELTDITSEEAFQILRSSVI